MARLRELKQWPKLTAIESHTRTQTERQPEAERFSSPVGNEVAKVAKWQLAWKVESTAELGDTIGKCVL